jgi:Sulfotransferase family
MRPTVSPPSNELPTQWALDLDPVEKSLTWIWGSPRSGSSWLLDLLCHPARVARHETLGFLPPEHGGTADVIPADEPSIGHHLAPFDGTPVAFYGEWHPGSVINGSEGRPTYIFAREHAATWKPWMRGLILARLGAIRDAAAARGIATGDAAIVVKETPSGHAADRVMDLLPSSRALLLTRDPRDVVDSLMHALRPGGFIARQFGFSYGEGEREAGIRWAAQTWAMSMDVAKHAIAAHDPALAKTVRYEDLRARPAESLIELRAWMRKPVDESRAAATVADLSFESLPSEQIGALKRNRSASPGAWRENLSADEADLVNEIAGERLERYGYARA